MTIRALGFKRRRWEDPLCCISAWFVSSKIDLSSLFITWPLVQVKAWLYISQCGHCAPCDNVTLDTSPMPIDDSIKYFYARGKGAYDVNFIDCWLSNPALSCNDVTTTRSEGIRKLRNLEVSFTCRIYRYDTLVETKDSGSFVNIGLLVVNFGSIIKFIF